MKEALKFHWSHTGQFLPLHHHTQGLLLGFKLFISFCNSSFRYRLEERSYFYTYQFDTDHRFYYFSGFFFAILGPTFTKYSLNLSAIICGSLILSAESFGINSFSELLFFSYMFIILFSVFDVIHGHLFLLIYLPIFFWVSGKRFSYAVENIFKNSL